MSVGSIQHFKSFILQIILLFKVIHVKLLQMKKSEMEYANSYCKDLVTVSKEIQEERLIQIGDINLNIALKPELWTRQKLKLSIMN